MSAAAVLLAAAVKVAPLAAALLEDMCLHCQGRPPAERGDNKRFCFLNQCRRSCALQHQLRLPNQNPNCISKLRGEGLKGMKLRYLNGTEDGGNWASL